MLNLLLGGIRATQRDVIRHSVRKKEWRLANYRRGYASYRVVTSSEEYHESEYPLADVEMTLNERQQGTLPEPVGPQIPSI